MDCLCSEVGGGGGRARGGSNRLPKADVPDVTGRSSWAVPNDPMSNQTNPGQTYVFRDGTEHPQPVTVCIAAMTSSIMLSFLMVGATIKRFLSRDGAAGLLMVFGDCLSAISLIWSSCDGR